MNKLLVLIIILLTSVPTFCQNSFFLTSFHNTLDKTKNPSRAQFGGNNNLINNYLSNQFLELRRITRDVNNFAQLNFHINEMGQIDSVVVVKSINVLGLDNWLMEIIKSTSGKWRPGIIDGTRVPEWNSIWINVYVGDFNKKTLKEYIQESKDYLNKGKYKKALLLIDKALNYDRFNTAAISLKGQIYIQQGANEQACRIWKEFEKFKIDEIQELLESNCN